MGDLKAVIETTRLEIYIASPRHETTVSLTERGKITVREPADLFPIMQRILLCKDKESRHKEHFWVVGFRPDNRIIYVELVGIGSTLATVASPMEIYQLAVLNKSPFITLVHNHVDGALIPSEQDKEITRFLTEGGRLLGISVVDHLIISEDEFFSFQKHGLIGCPGERRV
uniref:DNA repair protein RadC n=1 Tax=Candidatus Kentrum sp. DK TaxID=2126562 RepID=A0A450RTJ1_9GAMM|nr:MAG: DNA repair protein RadC [Candidatus Kentron sp. DK]VFJ48113.1 MAG: DNA repair protein RadC [Candidatus Kentron sp. DK]